MHAPGTAKVMSVNERVKELVEDFEKHHNVQILRKRLIKAFLAAEKNLKAKLNCNEY